jgi:catechol 2,3-dioxygenase-like lactoylglutathione lyase family enzyme
MTAPSAGGVPPQLNVITLGVRDFGAMRAFYAKLGWPLAVDLDDFAAFSLRGAVLTLFPLDRLAADARTAAVAPERGLRGFTLAIVVEEKGVVDSTIEAARAAGGRIAKEPADAAEFEGRHAYFADPEDNFWEVVCLGPNSRVMAAVRQATS